MAQYDYVIDETNNGLVNGVPSGINNAYIDNAIRNYQINQLLQQQGYRDPKNFMEAVYMMFNQGRAPKQKQQMQQYFKYPIGY